MKLVNLIQVQSTPIFGLTYYIPDIYDPLDPLFRGLPDDQATKRIELFSEAFLELLNLASLDQTISYLAYFNGLKDVWNLDSEIEYSLSQKGYSSFIPLSLRSLNQSNNKVVDTLKDVAPFEASDKFYLSYFPNSDDPIYRIFSKATIRQELLKTITAAGERHSAIAIANLVPLIDLRFDDEIIISSLSEIVSGLPENEKSKFYELAEFCPHQNPFIAQYKESRTIDLKKTNDLSFLRLASHRDYYPGKFTLNSTPIYSSLEIKEDFEFIVSGQVNLIFSESSILRTLSRAEDEMLVGGKKAIFSVSGEKGRIATPLISGFSPTDDKDTVDIYQDGRKVGHLKLFSPASKLFI